MKKTLLVVTLSIVLLNVFAQESQDDTTNSEDNINHNWHNKSVTIDQIYGVEVEKAYDQLLKNKKSTTVIVAVIDGGIDVNHEDLKNNIWINKNEIPENGIDDDNNGYVDDINGWNFLGNAEGENIDYENLEVTRIYREFKDKFENIEQKSLSETEKNQYEIYKKAKKIYLEDKNNALKEQKQLVAFTERYKEAIIKLEWYLDTNVITLPSLIDIKSKDKVLMNHVNFLIYLFSNDFTEESLREMKKYNTEEVDYHYNVEFKPREIIGDDPEDINTAYGNNNVYGPEADHGTFVSGIIGAERNNNTGINGIVENVKIMALKTVPNGDEKDKDVAKAIRYAVDNGARVVNMSFGKQLSPQKYLVDEAILYAEEKGVLLVHAAGNDGYNIDKTKQYPTKNISTEQQASNWITVGASSMNGDLEFAADFTNYGKNMVDIFAPGVDIESLAPESTYDTGDGTSFSAPVVTGVAALLLSYYPDLSYSDLKYIILSSAVQYQKTKVYKPGDYSRKRKTVKFGKLSVTGGLVSAYEALKLAETYKK
ncbi:MAG: S8 family peptidase [Bacteroidales bacterium]|nr:S8 family peptidase [Bacteroidales bacterium]